MIQVVLYEPEIPPNTGNIARTCAAFGVRLHLVEPLGFSLEDRFLRRAGLDYWPHVSLNIWPGWDAFCASGVVQQDRLVLASTRGATALPDFRFSPSDFLVFGAETRGLPGSIHAQSVWSVRIPHRPMTQNGVRSLNLSTAAGIIIYQALQQCHLLTGHSPAAHG